MNLLQRLKSGAGKATERAQNAVEVNRMNGHIVDIEREIGVHYMRMGEVFYEGYRAGDMSIAEEEMTELCKACDLLNEEIEEIRTRIAILKNERICECGTVVALDANFCPNCGRKMEKLATPRSEREATEERETSYESGIDALVASPHRDRDEEEVDLSELSADESEQRRAERVREDQERQDELDRLVQAWKQDLGIPHEEEQAEAASTDTTTQAKSAPATSGQAFTESPASPVEEARDPRVVTESAPVLEKEQADPGTFNCQVCGKALPKGSKWCPSCGTEQVV